MCVLGRQLLGRRRADTLPALLLFPQAVGGGSDPLPLSRHGPTHLRQCPAVADVHTSSWHGLTRMRVVLARAHAEPTRPPPPSLVLSGHAASLTPY
jgi:hypothetical protein